MPHRRFIIADAFKPVAFAKLLTSSSLAPSFPHTSNCLALSLPATPVVIVLPMSRRSQSVSLPSTPRKHQGSRSKSFSPSKLRSPFVSKYSDQLRSACMEGAHKRLPPIPPKCPKGHVGMVRLQMQYRQGAAGIFFGVVCSHCLSSRLVLICCMCLSHSVTTVPTTTDRLIYLAKSLFPSNSSTGSRPSVPAMRQRRHGSVSLFLLVLLYTSRHCCRFFKELAVSDDDVEFDSDDSGLVCSFR